MDGLTKRTKRKSPRAARTNLPWVKNNADLVAVASRALRALPSSNHPRSAFNRPGVTDLSHLLRLNRVREEIKSRKETPHQKPKNYETINPDNRRNRVNHRNVTNA